MKRILLITSMLVFLFGCAERGRKRYITAIEAGSIYSISFSTCPGLGARNIYVKDFKLTDGQLTVEYPDRTRRYSTVCVFTVWDIENKMFSGPAPR